MISLFRRDQPLRQKLVQGYREHYAAVAETVLLLNDDSTEEIDANEAKNYATVFCTVLNNNTALTDNPLVYNKTYLV